MQLKELEQQSRRMDSFANVLQQLSISPFFLGLVFIGMNGIGGMGGMGDLSMGFGAGATSIGEGGGATMEGMPMQMPGAMAAPAAMQMQQGMEGGPMGVPMGASQEGAPISKQFIEGGEAGVYDNY